jgi:hypothetical protein
MAVGDNNDFIQRLQNLIPQGWFSPGATPIRDALLAGIASAFTFIYSLLAYIRLQTRIATATDGWLDLIAYDFFANNLLRASGQSDTSFRNQIIAFLFRERNTRDALSDVVEQLLGVSPVITEPQRVTDTGAYSIPTTMGYGVAGRYGSMSQPLQVFVDVTVPGSMSIAPPNVGGYGSSVWGYGVGMGEYIGAPTVDPVLAADIYAAISSVLPVCGVAWVNINAGVAPTPPTPPSTSISMDSTLIDFSSTTVTFDAT